MPKNRKKRWAIVILLLACAIFSATGVMNLGLDAAGLKKLRDSNNGYLQESLDKTMKTFAVLSGVKVGLAIVQGSDIGIGFSLEVGDVVQSAYDYVDIAWRTVLGCAIVLLGTRYLLQMTDLLIPWFLTAVFLFLLLNLLADWKVRSLSILKTISRDLLQTFGLAAATLCLVLPLSIAGGRWLSGRITEPSMREARNGFTQVKNELEESSSNAEKGLWSKLVQAKDKLAKVTEIVTRKTSELTVWVLKLIAGYIFDCFVFPILLFLFLFWMVRKAVRYFGEINRTRGFRNDLEMVLKKYITKSE